MRNREKREHDGAGSPQPARNEEGRNRGRQDYWDNIADDVASGYGAQHGRDRSLLNPDQEPDDAQRGDV